MSQSRGMAWLFEERPWQWGLRGDPHLWDEMSALLAEVPEPESPEALSAVIQDAFLRLTGHALCEPDSVYVEKYNHGGMSGGYVCPRFWEETVIPLFQQRLFSPRPSE